MIKMLRVYDPRRWRMIGCKTGITYVILYPRVGKKCEGFVIKCTADATRRTALGKFPSTIYRSMSGDRSMRGERFCSREKIPVDLAIFHLSLE